MKDLTAKEKAIELYSKYYNLIEHTLSEEYSPHEIDVVKQCALIAVDEILNALDFNQWQNAKIINSFKEVREELEKL